MISRHSHHRHPQTLPKSPGALLALLAAVAALAACESRTVADARQPEPRAAIETASAVAYPQPGWSEFDLAITPVESVGAAAGE